jgi:hypothetical protein
MVCVGVLNRRPALFARATSETCQISSGPNTPTNTPSFRIRTRTHIVHAAVEGRIIRFAWTTKPEHRPWIEAKDGPVHLHAWNEGGRCLNQKTYSAHTYTSAHTHRRRRPHTVLRAPTGRTSFVGKRLAPFLSMQPLGAALSVGAARTDFTRHHCIMLRSEGSS